MRDLIVNKTPWFALGWLGCVVAGTGLGALAISSGTPLMVVVYTELVLQVALALAIAVGVRERVGGLVAVALTTVLPFGAFIFVGGGHAEQGNAHRRVRRCARCRAGLRRGLAFAHRRPPSRTWPCRARG